MRKADVFMNGKLAGYLTELEKGRHYQFDYSDRYNGLPVSLTMPLHGSGTYSFNDFPSFFKGLLPEGIMLEGLLNQKKIDRDDFFSQLVATGGDLVGAVTVIESSANE